MNMVFENFACSRVSQTRLKLRTWFWSRAQSPRLLIYIGNALPSLESIIEGLELIEDVVFLVACINKASDP